MELIAFAIRHDWPVLLPIVLSSIAVVAVSLERWWFYRRNKRDIGTFIKGLDHELSRSLDDAFRFCIKTRSIVGEVAAEGIRILADRKHRFEQSFDIAAALAARRLEDHLAVLSTIATISPYLGLFGTVVRILIVFGEMSTTGGGGGNASQIMFGIGSALIATAAGLGVAIVSVAINNHFRTVVAQFEDDFQLTKLLLLSEAGPEDGAPERPASQQAHAQSASQGQQPQRPIRRV